MLVLGILGLATLQFNIGSVLLVSLFIWAFVDFVLAVSGRTRDKEGNPVKNW